VKYLILEIERIPGAILFPEHLRYVDVAHSYQMLECCKLVAAGFFNVSATPSLDLDTATVSAPMAVEVFGASTSLNLSSRPEDAEIIFAELSRKSLQTLNWQTA
jgi:hypothetical protein